MAGGAQLIGDLLQGAFSSDLTNTNPAAGGYVYTPDQQLAHFNAYHDTNYKSIDEAQQDTQAADDVKKAAGTLSNNNILYDREGNVLPNDTIKSADDLLPMRKPNFWQRAFASGDAERANAVNANYMEQPEAEFQANRTGLGIGGMNTALARKNLNVPLQSQDPIGTYLLAGRNPDAQNLASLQANVPQQQASAEAATARNIGEQANVSRILGNNVAAPYNTSLTLGNENRYLQAAGNEGLPEARAGAEAAGAKSAEALTPQETQLQLLKLDGEIKAQPELNNRLMAEAKTGASLAQMQQEWLPYLKEKGYNDAVASAYLSRFVTGVPPIASTIGPGGTVSSPSIQGRIPGSMAEDILKSQQLNKLIGLPNTPIGTTPVTLASGRTVNVRGATPAIQNTGVSPVVIGQHIKQQQDEQQSTNAQTPVKGWPGFTQDSRGNIYKNGELASDEETALIKQMTQGSDTQQEETPIDKALNGKNISTMLRRTY